MNEESAARGLALIDLTVSAGAGVSPEHFLRIFGVPREDVTGSAAFGWRLFAVRTAFISGLAWRGDATARRASLPCSCSIKPSSGTDS